MDLRHRSVGPARGRATDSGEEAPTTKLAARKPFNNGELWGPPRVGIAEVLSRLALSRVAVGQITVRVETAAAADPGEWRVGSHQSAIERMTLAGFPPTRVFGGTSLVTTAPAATTEFSPTVTPPMIVAPAAIQTFLSITMGFPTSSARRWEGATGWPADRILTFGPIITSSPMLTSAKSYSVPVLIDEDTLADADFQTIGRVEGAE